MDWLSFPWSVLTLRCRSELGLAQVITGITPMAITDRIRTMATTTGIAIITATIVIITTDMGIKLT